MKFTNRQYKIILHKNYFDTGYGLTSFPKYIAAVLGIGNAIVNQSLSEIIIGGLIYAIVCYVIGFFWFRNGWVEASAEVGNQYNPFVKEVRTKLIKKTKV